MLRNLLNSLEDPTAPLLGPNIKFMKHMGLLLPKSKTQRNFYITLHMLFVTFAVTQSIDLLCVTSDLTLLLNNAKITMLSWVNAMKYMTCLIWQNSWQEVTNYLIKTDLEQRQTNDKINHDIIARNTKYCRKLNHFYWSVIIMTELAVILPPIGVYIISPSYRENTKNGDYISMVDAWVPFDKRTVLGYLASSAFQLYAVVFAGSCLAAFDSNCVVFMVAFKGEIELLRRDSSKIFGDVNSPVDVEEVKKRLRKCQVRHHDLMKYSKLFNSCLAPIMLLYFVVCSIMLCVTCYQIANEKNWFIRFMSAEYLSFGVVQLFMFCSHSNDVYYASQDLRWGPYESLWWCSKEYRKDVNLLIIQFSRIFVFTAGPFANLTMYSFISILKGAYSYYTLLSKK